MARAKRLKYTGQWIERRDPEGNIVVSGPSESFAGIPARDLTEDDVKALDDDQYRDATVSGLYVDPDAKKAAAKSPAKKKAATKKQAAKPPSAEQMSAEQAENVALADEGTDGGNADGPRAES
jgi:hypothetical protein